MKTWIILIVSLALLGFLILLGIAFYKRKRAEGLALTKGDAESRLSRWLKGE